MPRSSPSKPKSELIKARIVPKEGVEMPVLLRGDYDEVRVDRGAKAEVQGNVKKARVAAGHLSVQGSVGEAKVTGENAFIVVEGEVEKALALSGHISVIGRAKVAQAEGDGATVAIDGETGIARGLYGGEVTTTGYIEKAYAITRGRIETPGSISEAFVAIQSLIKAHEVLLPHESSDTDGMIIETGGR